MPRRPSRGTNCAPAGTLRMWPALVLEGQGGSHSSCLPDQSPPPLPQALRRNRPGRRCRQTQEATSRNILGSGSDWWPGNSSQVTVPAKGWNSAWGSSICTDPCRRGAPALLQGPSAGSMPIVRTLGVCSLRLGQRGHDQPSSKAHRLQFRDDRLLPHPLQQALVGGDHGKSVRILARKGADSPPLTPPGRNGSSLLNEVFPALCRGKPFDAGAERGTGHGGGVAG